MPTNGIPRLTIPVNGQSLHSVAEKVEENGCPGSFANSIHQSARRLGRDVVTLPSDLRQALHECMTGIAEADSDRLTSISESLAQLVRDDASSNS